MVYVCVCVCVCVCVVYTYPGYLVFLMRNNRNKSVTLLSLLSNHFRAQDAVKLRREKSLLTHLMFNVTVTCIKSIFFLGLFLFCLREYFAFFSSPHKIFFILCGIDKKQDS